MADYYVSLDGTVTKNRNKKKKNSHAYTVSSNGKITKNVTTAKDDDIAPVKKTTSVSSGAGVVADIAPTVMKPTSHNNMTMGIYEQTKKNQKKKEEKKDNRTWFQKSKGTTKQTIGASSLDLGGNVATGLAGVGEKVVDALMTIAPAVLMSQQAKSGMLTEEDLKNYERLRGESAEFVKKDLYNEEELVARHIVNPIEKKHGIDTETMSVFGEKSDELAQSAGQMGSNITASLINPTLGTVMLGATSFGAEAENAFRQGATYDEAVISASISAGAEVLSEKLSGGISLSGKTLDDLVPMDKLAQGISNKLVRNLINIGADATGEGFEEIVAGYASAVGQKMTYMDDKELSQIFSSEEALDSFLGGAILGGISSIGKTAIDTVKGKDSLSGLTNTEKTVFDKVYNDTVSEMEKDGKKLTRKEKNEIYDEVLKKLERGYIDTETIESVLGGETYKKLKSITDNETKLQEEYDSLKKEFDTLNKMKIGEMTGEQTDRKAELKNKLEKLKENLKNSSESQIKTEIRSQLDSEMSKIIQGTKLSESYNEKSRRSQAFEADLTKYDAKQQEVIKKATESGILNNTNRTHEFVDMIAKISADKGVSFDFINNAKLKESGFAIEGKTVNGYVKDGNIALNIDSKKALNTVVGHEITHVLEGTELYTELQNVVKEYATTKGEYQTRYDALAELYKDVDGAVIENKLTADLVGEYLFTDSDFVSRLSVEKPNIFKKIYEEIKYFLKVATGTKEAVQLEKVKRAFDKAYKEKVNVTNTKTKFSVSEGMSSTERYAELKDKQITVKEAKSNEILDSYDLKGKSLNDIYKFVRDNRESLGLNKTYTKEDIKIEFDYSNRGIKKSIRQTADSKVDEREFFDVLSNLDDIVENSILIERHGDKSDNADSRIKQVYVLLGAYQKNGNLTPVQLEIKEYTDNDNQLYLAVAIKKSEVNVTPTAEAEAVTNSDFYTYSIQDLVEKINPTSTDFLKYIPTEFLSEEQIKGKIEGLRRDVKKYPNSPFKQELEALEKETDNSNVNLSLGEQSAKAGDYRVYGKDIALDIPTKESLPVTEESLPIRRDYAPLTVEEAEERDFQRKEAVAPAQQTSEEPAEPKTVAERVEVQRQAVQTELDNNIQNRSDSYDAFTEKIENLQAKYDSKKNKETKAANDILRSIERTKRLRASVDADYSKRIGDLEKKLEKMKSSDYATAMQRQEKQKELTNWVSDLIGDTSTWVDKKMGIQYKTNTLRRNLRDVVRDADGKRDIAKADAIYDELQGKYNHNEAELKRESARIKKIYADMKITKAEDAYIQMLGELRHNPDTELTKEDVKKFYEKNKEHINTEKVDRAIEEARKTYDELLERVNGVLREQGMKEIPYRKGYFPHFTEEKKGFLAKLLNWKTINTEIPTDIAGMTETFKPNRSWQSFNKRRTGDDTDYSFMKGLDTYVHGSLDWIYHIEDIQKRRAFENQIRYVHSEQGIKDKIEAIKNNEMYDAEEAQEQIDLVYKEAGNPLHNFVQDLQDGTNALANKKSDLDRTVEKLANRKVYSTMTNISNRVTGNMVAGSVSSALTNFIPITQSWMQVSPVRSLQAMGETIRSIRKDDGMIGKSDYLTNRLRTEENLYKTGWDKISKFVGFMMEGADSFTSQVVWRSKYIDNISRGMSENAAIKNADQFAENVMAGRSRGNMPTMFNSKNPLIKTLTAFQLEVANQYGYMFKDAPQDMKSEGLAKLTMGYIKMFIGAYAYNALYSALTGRDAAFDPVGILQEFIGDLGGDDDEEKDVAGAIGGLASNVADEIPFVGGLLGGGRIPISSALPYNASISDAYADVVDKDWKSVMDELSKPLYYGVMPMGGGQIRKTVQGLSMFNDDLPVSGSYTKSGNLRFPVEDTFLNKLQAGVFGQYASETAREYFDRGQKPLQEKQIEEYKEVDIPISEYWDYRDGLSGLKTLSDKADYINSLDLPIDKKNILVNNQSDRKEPIDLTGFDDRYGNFDEFDFAMQNPDKYEIALQVGGYNAYQKYQEGMKGMKLAEKVDYVAGLDLSTEQKNALINGETDRKEPIDLTGYEKYDSYDEFKLANESPKRYSVSRVIGYDAYSSYMDAINDIKGDKDANGKTISGSDKKKTKNYIFGLNLDYGQKIILYRSLYSNKDDKNEYNADIVKYLDSRSDITSEEMRSILESLDMKVHSDGRITW